MSEREKRWVRGRAGREREGTHAKHENRFPFGPQTMQKRTSKPIFYDCWSDCVIWTVDGQWTDIGRHRGR